MCAGSYSVKLSFLIKEPSSKTSQRRISFKLPDIPQAAEANYTRSASASYSPLLSWRLFASFCEEVMTVWTEKEASAIDSSGRPPRLTA